MEHQGEPFRRYRIASAERCSKLACVPERRLRLKDLVAQVNEGGEKGWEAFATIAVKKGVTADTVAILFKRPKDVT